MFHGNPSLLSSDAVHRVFNHYSRIQADQEMMIQHQQQSQAEVEEISEDTGAFISSSVTLHWYQDTVCF